MNEFDTDAAQGAPRPTPADIRAYRQLEATAHPRAVEAAKGWRNGYAALAGGLGALLGLIGGQLDGETSWVWRLVLSVLFGGAILAVGVAVIMVVTVEGGLRTRQLSLRQIVAEYNSLQAYQVDQAAAALHRLDRSKVVAMIGALLGFAGLLVSLWLPGKHEDPEPDKRPTTSQTSTHSPGLPSPTSSVGTPGPDR